MPLLPSVKQLWFKACIIVRQLQRNRRYECKLTWHTRLVLAAAASACVVRQPVTNFHRICEAQTLGNSLSVGLIASCSSVHMAGGTSDRRWLKEHCINGLSYFCMLFCAATNWLDCIVITWFQSTSLEWTLPTKSHSAACGDLQVPCSKMYFGDCTFAVIGPMTWNRLPAIILTVEVQDLAKTHFIWSDRLLTKYSLLERRCPLIGLHVTAP